jgi:hypothetical protein
MWNNIKDVFSQEIAEITHTQLSKCFKIFSEELIDIQRLKIISCYGTCNSITGTQKKTTIIAYLEQVKCISYTHNVFLQFAFKLTH